MTYCPWFSMLSHSFMFDCKMIKSLISGNLIALTPFCWTSEVFKGGSDMILLNKFNMSGNFMAMIPFCFSPGRNPRNRMLWKSSALGNYAWTSVLVRVEIVWRELLKFWNNSLDSSQCFPKVCIFIYVQKQCSAKKIICK